MVVVKLAAGRRYVPVGSSLRVRCSVDDMIGEEEGVAICNVGGDCGSLRTGAVFVGFETIAIRAREIFWIGLVVISTFRWDPI